MTGNGAHDSHLHGECYTGLLGEIWSVVFVILAIINLYLCCMFIGSSFADAIK